MVKGQRLLNSFRYALRGLYVVFRDEQNFRLQIAAACIIIVLMFVLGIKAWEKIVALLVITLVLVLELINSIIERVVDMLKPRLHPYVEVVKDIMAGAVLLSSMAAVIIGLLIFVPYLY